MGGPPPPDAPKAETLWPLTLAICGAHAPPRQAGAFIYDHLGRVEQTYFAEGRLFLFIKFMALPRLHTVKTGRIGPKVSYRMTASDVRTSVNSVGAVEGNKAADNSEARCPVKRWGLRASRRGIQSPTWKGSGVGVCWWPRQVASGPWICLVTGSLGYFGVGIGRRGTGVLGPSGIWLQDQQLERVPSLWISTCRRQRGERNADSTLLGGWRQVRPLRRALWQRLSESWKCASFWPHNSKSENFTEGKRFISEIIGLLFLVFSACCSLKRKIGNKCPKIGSSLFKNGYLTIKDCKKYHKATEKDGIYTFITMEKC